MIGLVRGVLVKRIGDNVLVDCGGVGYEVVIPESSIDRLPAPRHEVTLFTHLIWKEDGVTLYGFLNEEDREMFRMLIQVSGVGPKMAMSCLSVLGPLDLLKALSSGDVKRLQAISGIGRKTAARLCVDLKEKARKLLSAKGGEWREHDTMIEELGAVEEHDGLWQEAYSALLNLGYRPQEIRRALSLVFSEIHGQRESGQGGVLPQDLGSIITHALRQLAR